MYVVIWLELKWDDRLKTSIPTIKAEKCKDFESANNLAQKIKNNLKKGEWVIAVPACIYYSL